MTFDLRLVKPSISCIHFSVKKKKKKRITSTWQSEGEPVGGRICVTRSLPRLSGSPLCWFERKRGQLPDTDSVRWNERRFFFFLPLFLLTPVMRKRHHGTGADRTGLPLSQRDLVGTAGRTQRPLLKLKLCLGKRSYRFKWLKVKKKGGVGGIDWLIYWFALPDRSPSNEEIRFPRLSDPHDENPVCWLEFCQTWQGREKVNIPHSITTTFVWITERDETSPIIPPPPTTSPRDIAWIYGSLVFPFSTLEGKWFGCDL